jgi:hypothetical protein
VRIEDFKNYSSFHLIEPNIVLGSFLSRALKAWSIYLKNAVKLINQSSKILTKNFYSALQMPEFLIENCLKLCNTSIRLKIRQYHNC